MHEHDDEDDNDDDLEAEDDVDDNVPDGAAVFPAIPAELNVSGTLLAIIHAVVFIAGSDEKIVHPAAAEEALGTIVEYLGRISAEERQRLLDDLKALREYAKEQGWPKVLTAFLKSFPKDFGIIGDDE